MNEEIIQLDELPMEDSIIKVIGIGGGGSNAVNHMFKQGIRGVTFVVCNTDNQALQNSPVGIKVQLGKELTHGRGAGNEANRGMEAAVEDLAEMKNLLQENTKMIFLTAGMGGGTGTGAAPVIAQLAKELDILTVAIVTLPFSFEGEKRWNQAIRGIQALKDHVDALLIIHNDRLREIYGDQKLSVAFANADNVLAMAAKGIAEIITVHGYVNVDFADVKTVMKSSGVAIMGSGISSGENRAQEAIKAALISPLLNNNNLKGAKNILLNINSGTKEVLMDEVTEIMEFIQRGTGMETDIIWGNGYDDSLGESLSITIVATGLNQEIGLGELESSEEAVNFLLEEQVSENKPEPEKVVFNKVEDEPELDQVPLEIEAEHRVVEDSKIAKKKKKKSRSSGWIGTLFDNHQ